jgi:hypothetical protein
LLSSILVSWSLPILCHMEWYVPFP